VPVISAAPAPGAASVQASVPPQVTPSVSPPSVSPPSIPLSGPVPKLEVAAAGSGPHEPAVKRLPIPADAEAALRAWNTVLDELHADRKGSLAALFNHARVMTWTATELVLGFPVEDHSIGDMAKDRADEIAAFVHSLGPDQKTVRVAIRLLNEAESQTAGARSLLETSRERNYAERTKREAEARAHPITQHVLQTFGAQIKEIKTDV
jgi:RNase H-fold protein (predicted Holliday junction resolvase)